MSATRLLGAALASLALATLPALGADPPAAKAAPGPANPAVAAARAAAEAAGIKVVDLVVGKGPVATAGAAVRVNYTGWLDEPTAADGKGKQFDTSVGKDAFLFTLGRQQVIRGWDLGVAGMQAGGKRRLVIPASAGYGPRGAGGVIPPNATLVFDVELIDFLPPLGP
jgi:FKBP-type peptidyl-prolyl cis-trans isomerase FkpA